MERPTTITDEETQYIPEMVISYDQEMFFLELDKLIPAFMLENKRP